MHIEASITFDTQGRALCLWSEAIPLTSLGAVEVERASTVEFNHTTQEWEVRWAAKPDKLAFSHPSRDVCLSWERSRLNAIIHH